MEPSPIHTIFGNLHPQTLRPPALKPNILRLQALAERERAVRDGALATVIFLRSRNAKGHEVSGYIDYGHRLSDGDMAAIFSGTEPLVPRPTDLSYYNYVTQAASTTASNAFEVSMWKREDISPS